MKKTTIVISLLILVFLWSCKPTTENIQTLEGTYTTDGSPFYVIAIVGDYFSSSFGNGTVTQTEYSATFTFNSGTHTGTSHKATILFEGKSFLFVSPNEQDNNKTFTFTRD